MTTLSLFGDGGKHRLDEGFGDPYHQNEKTRLIASLSRFNDENPVDLPDLYRAGADWLTQKPFTVTTSALVDWLLVMSEEGMR
ncbi:MAG: hypothetical protein EA367_15830 [Leptolyngbya sp. DLM2.Bin15]|nr:MAG: hypothetical protein EA367_15830 [Leptolyngbya sp. DLM2.Bin15]